MKRKIFLTICVFLIIVLALTRFTPNHEAEKISSDWTLIHLTDLNFPRQLLWYEDSLFLVKDLLVYEFDFNLREVGEFGEISEKEMLGVYKGNLVYIYFENYIILDPSEYATKVVVRDFYSNEEIFSQNFHETVKPVFFKNNLLILEDNYLNSPERKFKFDLKTKEIEIYDAQLPSLKGEENIFVLDENNYCIFYIPKMNDIYMFDLNPEKNKIAMQDISGNVWLYLRK